MFSKKSISILSIGLAFFLLGCQNGDNSQPTSPPTSGQEQQVPDTAEPKAPADQKTYYGNLADKIVAEKGDLDEAIRIYKKLTELFPVDHKYRQEVLQYIMKETLTLVTSANDEDVQRGLTLSLKLYGIMPGDFYVENRLFAAYKHFATNEMNLKHWRTAEEWTLKGLRLRFDMETMLIRLKILLGEAKEFIMQKKYTEAKKNLYDVMQVANTDNNNLFFSEQKDEAEKLLKQIPQ